MKKTVILAATLLLAAVFMSGCITAPASEDPVAGIWMETEQFSDPEGIVYDSLTYVFAADGTGYSLSKFNYSEASGKLDFTWENAGDGKYLISITDTKETGVPAVNELVLAGDVLTFAQSPEGGIDLHRAAPEEYVPGIWTGIRGDYKEHTDIQALLHLAKDGAGELIVYGMDVQSLEDLYWVDVTWKAEGGKVLLTGEKGKASELALVNGELIFEGDASLHKLTVEDSLYGIWQSDEPHVEDGVSYDIIEFIKSDGTGVEIWTVPGSDEVSKRFTFTWKMINSTAYEAVYDDGEVWEFKAVYTQLYDGETWYNKVRSDVLTAYAKSKVDA